MTLHKLSHSSSELTDIATHMSSPEHGYTPWGAISRCRLPMVPAILPVTEKSKIASPNSIVVTSLWERSTRHPEPVLRRRRSAVIRAPNDRIPTTGSG